jgi:hypothetical protein
LPAILALGIITSYSDIKEGKIRNKWIISALIYALVVYLILITSYYLKGTLRVPYLVGLLTNIIFTVMIGFGMWLGSLWTSGDAKLFIAFSALVPLSVYSYGYVKWFPSITLLINTFVPLFIVFFAIMMFKTSFEQKKQAIGKEIKPAAIIQSFISLFAIYWGFQFLLSSLNLPQSFFFSALSSVVVLRILRKIVVRFFKRFFFLTVVIASLRFIIDKSVYSIAFFNQMLFLLFFWLAFSGLVSNLGKGHFSKKVPINKLAPGMLPVELIYKDEHKGMCFKESQTNLFKIKKKPVFEQRPEGLEKEEIEKLKKLLKQKKLAFRELDVSQTLPFAPFMFMGVVLTIIAKGNILILIMNLI